MPFAIERMLSETASKGGLRLGPQNLATDFTAHLLLTTMRSPQATWLTRSPISIWEIRQSARQEKQGSLSGWDLNREDNGSAPAESKGFGPSSRVHEDWKGRVMTQLQSPGAWPVHAEHLGG